MEKITILRAISGIIEIKAPNYAAWTIGITQDPANRKNQHKSEGENVHYWMQWKTDSLLDAQSIESYFINSKHMKGGTGGNLVSGRITFVYIF